LLSGDTLTIGDLSVFTGTVQITGAANTTIALSRHANLTISGDNSSGTITGAGQTISFTSIGGLKISNDDHTQSPTFDASLFAGTIDFALPDNFGGTVTVEAATAATATIDFTGNAGTLTISGSSITSTTSGTVTVSGPKAIGDYQYNFSNSFASGVETDLTHLIDTLKNDVSSAASSLQQLTNAIPFLDRAAGLQSGLSKLVALADTFNKFAAAADAKISALGSSFTLGSLLNALNAITWPSPLNLTFTGSYLNLGGTVAPAVAVTVPELSYSHTFNLDLGPAASKLGIQISSTTTSPPQPVSVPITATLDVSNLKLGFDGTTPVLGEGLDVHAHFGVSISTFDGSVSLGILKANIHFPATSFSGDAHLGVTDDGDGEILVGDLATDFTHSFSTSALSVTITASLGSDLTIGPVGGSHSPLLSATLTINAPANSLFGDSSGSEAPQVNFTTTSGGGLTDLASSFSSAGPLQILQMLSQVGSFLAGLASQQIMSTTIPFTNVTIGSALDYARAFKHDVLDPLFKSGDASHPDADNDGSVDFNDLNFDSIQGLLDKLAVAVGLAPGTIKANLDTSTNQLTFNFSFDRQLGIGTPVDVLTAPAASVASTSTANVQELTIGNATSGNVALTYTWKPTASTPSVASQSSGSLIAGTYYYELVATTAAGFDTLASPEISAVVTSPSTDGAVQLQWSAFTGATGYKIYRGNAPGAEDRYIASSGTTLSDDGTNMGADTTTQIGRAHV
jgi:hypothetical protein